MHHKRGLRTDVKAAKRNIKRMGKVRASVTDDGQHGKGKGKGIEVQINTKGGGYHECKQG